MTTLLPPGKSQFQDSNGVPLAGGSVTFYIPGTTTFKATWQDPSQLALNTNPVILDASGEAIIYGVGAYRQIVKDSLGNLIWDQLTASTDTGGVYSGGTSTGTANNQIVLTPIPAGFALIAGNLITFIAGFTNTGAATLNANGTGAKPILRWGAAGPVALVGGELAVGNAVALFYDGTQFQIVSGLPGKQPTRTVKTSGSGTYTTPTGATRLHVTMIGSGGGGAGAGTTSTAGSGGTGGDTTFGAGLTATHGGAGTGAGGSVGGAGGSATGGDINLIGGAGGTSAGSGTAAAGATGASSPFGGGGAAGTPVGGVGGDASVNTGAGGGGAGNTAGGVIGGGGGGAGGYLWKLIIAPAATYAYAVGAGGAAGASGTGGNGGGLGGSGIIIIDEFYN